MQVFPVELSITIGWAESFYLSGVLLLWLIGMEQQRENISLSEPQLLVFSAVKQVLLKEKSMQQS